MGRSWVLVVCALSGCDYFWHLDHVDTEIDADAAPGGDALCSGPPFIDEDFRTTGKCGTWGMPYEHNSVVMQGAGSLVITPTSTAPPGSDGGCDGPLDVPFADGGIIVQVGAVIDGNWSYTGIQAMGGVNASIQVSAGDLRFQDYDATNIWKAVTWLGPTQMGWMRLRPDRSAGQIVAEYSSDGHTWRVFASKSLAIPSTIKPVIVAGVVENQTWMGKAVLHRFVVCAN